MSVFKISQNMSLSEKFIWSSIIDGIGIVSYLFPGLEILDLFWAPLSSHLIYKLYGNKFMSTVAIGEEIMPLTDFIPTALLTWFFELLGIIKGRGVG